MLGLSAFGCVEALRWRSEPVRAMQPGSLRGVDLCGDFAAGLLEESMFLLKNSMIFTWTLLFYVCFHE